jgi:outer membrane protein OmpA-like peptidoglycan-associated protein
MKFNTHTPYLLILFFLSLSFIGQGQFVQEKAIQSGETDGDEKQDMQIEVFDGVTRDGIKADIMIKGLNPRMTVTLENISDTTLEINNYRLYTVSCVKEGYMYFAHKFWPDESRVHVEPVELMPLAVGLKSDIQDITFLGDETEIYHKSVPALTELIRFLDVNPLVDICIIGHVNGPDKKIGDMGAAKASEKRAIAVKEYLIEHGISAKRLTIRGAGNTEMIYPDPKTEWQVEANRRVEIEITDIR